MEKYITSELEKRLAAFDDVSPILNDTQLKAALNKIIEETEPKTDADIALIDEAVDMLLELENVDVDELELSSKVWGEKYKAEHKFSPAIKFKKSRKSIKIKWLMPVAALLSILFITVIISSAAGIDVWQITKEAYINITEKIEQLINGSSVVSTKDCGDYNSLSELTEKEDIYDVLLPINLQEGYVFRKIFVGDYGDKSKITINIVCEDVEISTIIITTSYSANYDEKLLSDFYGYKVQESNYDNIYQIEFDYGDNHYRIKAFDYEDLIHITKSLATVK